MYVLGCCCFPMIWDAVVSPNSASTLDYGCVTFLNVCIEELCVALWARGCWWVVDSHTCWLLPRWDCVSFLAIILRNCVCRWPSFPYLELWNAAIIYCVFGLLIYPGLGVAAELFWPL